MNIYLCACSLVRFYARGCFCVEYYNIKPHKSDKDKVLKIYDWPHYFKDTIYILLKNIFVSKM